MEFGLPAASFLPPADTPLPDHKKKQDHAIAEAGMHHRDLQTEGRICVA